MNETLRAKLKNLPARPGVYFHKSKNGEIIYIGKAAVLKNRVRQYFQKNHDDIKTRALVKEIFDIDWIETDSEIDALFLEAEMIKRYMPQFNILLRDDKSSTYVRINFFDNEIPFVTTTRQPSDDKAEYIGPFYSAFPIKNALKYLRKVFPFFTKKSELNLKLPRQLNLVPDIFENGKIDENKMKIYKKDLRKLMQVLQGKRAKISGEIEKEMKLAAKNLQFERAAELRNKLRNLSELKKQIIFSRDEFMDISRDAALNGLKKMLNLPEIPRRIEAYDISHISGTNNVASMVVATNGLADKREYRKFKISRDKNDDFAAMREVLTRRFSARHTNWRRPNLIILDGSKAQISAARKILQRENIPFIARDKSGDHSANAKVKIIIPEGKIFREVKLKNDDHIAKFIARLDGESHRFAITYHQNLRDKNQIKNTLEDISGIGPATRKKLLRKFGSISGIKNANEAEIAKIIGATKAKIIRQNLIP